MLVLLRHGVKKAIQMFVTLHGWLKVNLMKTWSTDKVKLACVIFLNNNIQLNHFCFLFRKPCSNQLEFITHQKKFKIMLHYTRITHFLGKIINHVKRDSYLTAPVNPLKKFDESESSNIDNIFKKNMLSSYRNWLTDMF